jgi:hypothetical protein
MLKRALQVTAITLAGIAGCKDSGPPPVDPASLQYDIEVRFFGTAMTAAQQQLFTNAAARLEQIITGDLVNAAASSVNLDDCPNVDESIPVNEEVDDVIIYASIRSIDGAGRVLASASPCFTRPTSAGAMTAFGIMVFDEADLNTLSQGGNLQDVITHEMLHVLGVGTLWANHTGLIADTGTANPRYLGPEARAGCIAAGGTLACAQHVPVEGNDRPVGTRDSHWKETVFNTEMMTGFLDANTPISAITVGSLKDLGFTVDASKADAYTMPPTGFGLSIVGVTPRFSPGWEHVGGPVGSLENGRVIPARPR